MTSKEDVVKLILAKGDEIREMKASGSTKDEIMKHVEALQKFKQLYQVNAAFIVHKSVGLWLCTWIFLVLKGE